MHVWVGLCGHPSLIKRNGSWVSARGGHRGSPVQLLQLMLTFLNISNIALIDELTVEFDRGLNLLTGETGSGKSIIVDALGVLIGGRFTADLLKAGRERGSIEGLFYVSRNREMEELLADA